MAAGTLRPFAHSRRSSTAATPAELAIAKIDFSKIEDQPAPISTTGRPIWDLVIADMAERDHIGRQRYGTPLQAHNGRDALVAAYQEALDLVVYLRQAIEERNR
jgi:hypothetical protein